MKNFLHLILVSGCLFSLLSCNEKAVTENAKANLQIRLTDDPAGFDAVNIDIIDILYNNSTDSTTGWVSVPGAKKGIYNLLDLVNDKDTLLADAEIPTGRLQQLRLVLGDRNTIVVNGVSTTMQTPSAQQSGLKLNIQQDIENGVLYKLLLDFDVARSVVKAGNSGKYILKPVIRTVLEAQGGSVNGVVTPPSFPTAVLLIQNTDTPATTFTSTMGNYLIKGVKAGTYDIHFVPTDTTYDKSVKNGVIVTDGKVTRVDTAKLSQ
jgi:hypothetical protein